MKLVIESLTDVFKSRDEITLNEIENLIEGLRSNLKKEGPDWKLYNIGDGYELSRSKAKIKYLIKKYAKYYNSSFHEFYFIIDENNKDFDRGIIIEVNPNQETKAFNINGEEISNLKLEKYIN